MKPILFNTEMVRAILDGRKTVTRRVVKPHYRNGEAGFRVVFNTHTGGYVRVEYFDEWENKTRNMVEPYHPRDILYVRETWQQNYDGSYAYRAGHKFEKDSGWRPSIHMPREAARIFLRVTDVRVERLQDITDQQAESEGVTEYPFTSIGAFGKLWDSTIKPTDRALYGWDANPFVWVIEFEQISKEEAMNDA